MKNGGYLFGKPPNVLTRSRIPKKLPQSAADYTS